MAKKNLFIFQDKLLDIMTEKDEQFSNKFD